jgi:transcriptional regulator with GAF, ATPase, and Fis domain
VSSSKDKERELLLEKIRRLEEQIQDFERLNRILETVCSTMQVEKVLKRILEEALLLCNASQGSILLLDPQHRKEARTLVREGLSRDIKLDHYLNTLLAGWISRHGETLLTGDLTKTFGPDAVEQKYREITSVLSVPLILRGNIIGVINLITLGEGRKLRQRDARLIKTLANQCTQFIQNARSHEELFEETERLKKEVRDKYGFQGIIGYSPKMQAVFSLLERIIPTEGRVLLEGESGTGKEQVARVIHYNGPRKSAPFVAIDCGALPANLLESELFGYLKGAFTGANRDRKGLFEEAHRGTLFLDEIANMPLEIQPKFLRAIQEGEIRPLGTSQNKKVDVRIIAAASESLRKQMEAGTFRQDLFYRLNVVSISLPPLRERKEDITILANHFLSKMAEKYHKQIKGFKPETIISLESYAWPGNVRELENMVERAIILTEQDTRYITPELLPAEIQNQETTNIFSIPEQKPGQNIKSMKDTYEKEILLKALMKHNWNQSSAAEELGVNEKTVRYKMQKYGIKKP